ncbi:O-acetyl-ADP-ribose deacetylase [Salinimicrobium sp. GXAS 041]|uniref:O-acetyl-ADP-ribose deacetylase n=1 Tax=Salinimicrobium sp. GXAS 041 TaxID=3400806 RepID=UPI003C76E7F7
MIEVLKGDITKVAVDAVVNAANSSLMGGGGVDGAIHRAGGPAILEECKQIVQKQGNCPTGAVVVTTAGELPAKYVIHTVGPVWNGGEKGENEKLAACYRNSLELAVQKKCNSVAFPNISTGVFGFPKKNAAQIAVSTVQHFLRERNLPKKVLFVCFDEENEKFIREELDKR